MADARVASSRVSGLDAVRFLAALMVVATHFGPTKGIPFRLAMPFGSWGGNGVAVFFVLSGYLLWRPFVRGRPNIFEYALSRAARILPAYWLAAVVLVALRGGDLASYLVMRPDRAEPLGVVWTLEAEVMFYLAVPVLALLRRPLLLPVALGAASLALELMVAQTPLHGGGAEVLLPVRFWQFAPGMILAAWQPRTGRNWLAAGLALLAAGAAVLPFTPGSGGGQTTDVVSVGGAFFLVGWGIAASPRGRTFWAAGAAVSYALYLWHVDLFFMFGAIGLPLAFVVASLSYRLLEKPVMDWARRRIDAHRASRALPRSPAAGLAPTLAE